MRIGSVIAPTSMTINNNNLQEFVVVLTLFADFENHLLIHDDFVLFNLRLPNQTLWAPNSGNIFQMSLSFCSLSNKCMNHELSLEKANVGSCQLFLFELPIF